MDRFPAFMQHPANRIATTDQATQGVEGYVFDGAEGSQLAFWTCRQTATSTAHVHDYDEYMIVVQGCFTLIVNGQRIPLNAGAEYLIARGTRHSGEVVAGTRTIHCFGGHRADRVAT
jgi:quercetin dioxygenase-like cupin family protein